MATSPAVKTRFTTEDDITAEVLRRFEGTPDPRLREILLSLTKHLHAFAKEVRLNEDEWFKAILYLTATGQMCSDKRQEFILLSDTMGLSMLVDLISNGKPPGATESTVFGPFVSVTLFRDEAEVLDIANSTEYGLGGGLWTRDLQRGHRVAAAINTGMVWVNSYKRVNPGSPFGGVGQSGYGREMGFEAMHDYTDAKSVWINVDAQLPPFYKR